ncbi:MAG TPA: hypothetical protein VMU87_02770 [Stellaceae bacterium]|nr:hypothetical protein [Stellaceae bacterium]
MSDNVYFRSQSARCRRLARQCADAEVATRLETLAEEFERKARELDPVQPRVRNEPGA